jgi:hypothetical protein
VYDAEMADAPRFDPDDSPAAQDIRREVLDRRDCGAVTIEFRRVASDVSAEDVAKAFATSVGLHAPSTLRKLHERDALRAATRVLHEDLAYSALIMSAELATSLATRFVEHCGGDAEFFTNGEKTSATFDTGVIGVSRDRACVLWVEDED